jgi:hypothetical protein
MSERWIKDSERLLKRLKEIASKKHKDRLETIDSMLFSINTLERSLRNWKRWFRNLSVMSQFTQADLEDLEKVLRTRIQDFVEYDVEATKRWKHKLPRVRLRPQREQERDEDRSMYV